MSRVSKCQLSRLGEGWANACLSISSGLAQAASDRVWARPSPYGAAVPSTVPAQFGTIGGGCSAEAWDGRGLRVRSEASAPENSACSAGGPIAPKWQRKGRQLVLEEPAATCTLGRVDAWASRDAGLSLLLSEGCGVVSQPGAG